MVDDGHWVRWHDAYADPASSLSRRLAAVQRRLRDALDAAPPGPLRVLSMCAGDGRDVLGVLADHPRRGDVTGRLVELDPDLVARARRTARDAHLEEQLDIVEGDASRTSAYAGATPADVLLVCGVFGNISDDDVLATVQLVPHLAATGAAVVWTRHRRPPDLTPTIRRWFTDHDCPEIAFDTEPGTSFGVGSNRFVGAPRPLGPDRQIFTFFGDGLAAHA